MDRDLTLGGEHTIQCTGKKSKLALYPTIKAIIAIAQMNKSPGYSKDCIKVYSSKEKGFK